MLRLLGSFSNHRTVANPSLYLTSWPQHLARFRADELEAMPPFNLNRRDHGQAWASVNAVIATPVHSGNEAYTMNSWIQRAEVPGCFQLDDVAQRWSTALMSSDSPRAVSRQQTTLYI